MGWANRLCIEKKFMDVCVCACKLDCSSIAGVDTPENIIIEQYRDIAKACGIYKPTDATTNDFQF